MERAIKGRLTSARNIVSERISCKGQTSIDAGCCRFLSRFLLAARRAFRTGTGSRGSPPLECMFGYIPFLRRGGTVRYSGIQLDTAGYVRIQLDPRVNPKNTRQGRARGTSEPGLPPVSSFYVCARVMMMMLTPERHLPTSGQHGPAPSGTPPPAQPPPPPQTRETQSHSAPTPLKRPMLTPEGGPRPRVSA